LHFFSGGLLFPWHIGALAGLSYHNVLDDSNPLAGSSAGAIAVASHGAGVRPEGKKTRQINHLIYKL
jgi:predicted acylesterase/phospholipase RssA